MTSPCNSRVHYVEDGGTRYVPAIDQQVTDGMVIDYAINADPLLQRPPIAGGVVERERAGTLALNR